MAGRPLGSDLEQEAILIAIDEDFLHPHEVTGGFALAPELLPGPRPESGKAGSAGRVEAFGIHVGDHQRLARRRIDHHGRQKALGIEAGRERISHALS